MRLIFKGAQRVGDALKCVLDGMGKIIHREDAPLGSLTVMLDVTDTVEDRIAHVEVAALQIDLCAQRVAPFFKLAVLHALKQIETFLDRTIAPGTDSGMRRIAAVFAELLGCQLADIGKTLADQLKSIFIRFIEIIRTVEEAIAPVKAEPVDVVLNSVDILGVFLGGIGIIHAQIADAAEVLGRGKVDRQRFAVTDVQISVRLGWKAGVDLHAVAAVAFL